MALGRYVSATAAAAAVLAGWGPGAEASVVVLGGSLASQCSRAAVAGEFGALAVDLCTRSLKEEPLSLKNRAATHVNRGVLLMRRREYGPAMADFDQAATLAPALGEAYANRGSVHLIEGRAEAAAADFDHALSLRLEQPERIHFNRAMARERLDDAKGAYLDYRRAAELAPSWPEPREQLVRFTVVRR